MNPQLITKINKAEALIAGGMPQTKAVKKMKVSLYALYEHRKKANNGVKVHEFPKKRKYNKKTTTSPNQQNMVFAVVGNVEQVTEVLKNVIK